MICDQQPSNGSPIRPNHACINVSDSSRDDRHGSGFLFPHDDGEAEQEADAGEEQHDPRVLRAPEEPSAEERERHFLSGHVVYRSWCRHCVRGRGRAWMHRSGPDRDHTMPTISFDYGYLSRPCTQEQGEEDENSQEEEDGSCPMLVMWDTHTKSPYAHLLPSKGIDFRAIGQAALVVSKDIAELGYKRILVWSEWRSCVVRFSTSRLASLWG